MTADSASINQNSSNASSMHDQHLSQCIQLKQNYLNNSSTNIYENLAANFQNIPRDASRVSIDDPLCRKMGETDIMYADQPGSDVLVNSPQIRNANCECGLCPKPAVKDNNTLSDLQRSVNKCSCDACNSNGDILSYYKNCSNQNTDSGIVYCDICQKQKISISNFRALQIANNLRISEDRLENGGDDELCRKIDMSLNMNEIKGATLEHRKRHNRHNSEPVTPGIDLSQFCVCELESKRKTSSVDEIFKLVDESSNTQAVLLSEENKSSLRQRSLSDSQRDKAKVDNKGM